MVKKGPRLGLAALLVVAALSAGCTVGDWSYDSPPAAGVQVDQDGLKVRNLMIVADETGLALLQGTITATETTSLIGVAVAPLTANGELAGPTNIGLVTDPILPAEPLQIDGSSAVFENPDLQPGGLAVVAMEFDDGTIIEIETPLVSSQLPAYQETFAQATGV